MIKRSTIAHLLTIIILYSLFSCHSHLIKEQNSSAENIDSLTSMIFINKTINFGTVPSDTLLIARYFFTNTGNKNLRIKYVDPDCTCTNYNLPNQLILPTDTSFIELRFETKGKFGEQIIRATVCSNTSTKLYLLTLKASVI